jgi:(p)ppGpp synthase/HD superfamily hydrolase
VAGPLLTERFDEALAYASDAHRDQVRKGTRVPYVSHLLAVAGRVLEEGGDEDEAIAALLHDVVEDQGGAARLADVAARFGSRVAAIVAGTSDTDQSPKPPWRQRKERYLAHLADPSTSRSVLLVSAADKLHNARTIVRDLGADGPSTWARFNAGVDDQLWYYRELREILVRRLPGPLTDELAEVVAQMEEAAGRSSE